ncbi:MAG: 4'-phosphopantetheinyl transferase superfamily protein [Synergistaceae bacterium]|nr:4'-phosphopantetheinyl transferase superfamily protein [Synergistaceae bacterium]
MLTKFKFLNTEIYIVNIASKLDKPVDKYLKFFTPERQARIMRYKFNADRNRTLWAELLARKIISRKLNINFNKIIISRDESGRPFINNINNNKLNFSISHSGDYIAVSVGENLNGVDIETRARDKLDLNIAKRFFLQHEYNYLLNLNQDLQDLQTEFLKIWTLKESCLKCLNLNEWTQVDTFQLLNSKYNNAAGQNFILPDFKAVIGVCEI